MNDPQHPSSQSKRSILSTCGSWLRQLFSQVYAILRQRWMLILLVPAAMLILTVLLFPHDPTILQSVQSSSNDTLMQVSRGLSNSGKFEYVPLLLPAAIALLGLIRRQKRLYQIAAVILLAGLVAGIAVNILRPTFGRARPSSGEVNGFYGPSAEHRFNSFPSGHSTTAWATAVSTSLTLPVLAPPALAWATGVSISRMYQNSHYLSDVVSGALLGSLFGWILVRGWRRMNRE